MEEKPWTILQYIQTQVKWSLRTFQQGRSDTDLIDNIQKKLDEIKNQPGNLMKWVDIIILSLDGAWRNCHTPADIIKALREKQLINITRHCPDNQEAVNKICIYVTCSVCNEWYEAEPEQCEICGEENEFTKHNLEHRKLSIS